MATTFQGGELLGKSFNEIKNKALAQEEPSWIGGTGNPNYRPGMQTAGVTSQWTAAERARLKAIEQQKKMTMEALNQAQQNVGREFEAGKTTLSGQYQAGRRSLAEYLAQRGQTSSGVAAQGQIQGLSALGQGLAQLETAREQSLANIAQQRAMAEQTALQQQADIAGQAEEQAFNRDLAAIQSGAYQQDIQAEINRRMALNPNDPTIPFLQAQRNQKLAGISQAEAEARQQEFENQLALARLQRTGAGGGGGTSGMTDEEYRKFAIQQATSGGIFSQSTFDQIMSLRYGTPETSTSATPAVLSDRTATSNPQADITNLVLQYEGGRITKNILDMRLRNYGYKFDSRTNSVVPL